MFIIFPIGQESELRRWPWVTIGIVSIMVLIHLYVEFTTISIKHEYEHVSLQYDKLLARFSRQYFRKHLPDLNTGVGSGTDTNLEQIMTYTRDLEKNTLKALESGELVSKDSEAYRLWIDLKKEKERLEKRLVVPKLAFNARHPKPWMWITSLFLHGGVFHLFFNMVFLWFTGVNLEDRWGKIVYSAVFLGGGVAGNAAFQYMHSGIDLTLMGASGAISALMGAFLVLFPFVPIRLFFLWFGFSFVFRTFTIKAYNAILFWFVIQVSLMAVGIGNIAYEAHVGGFMFGVVFALICRITGLDRFLNEAQERIVDSKTTEETYRVNPVVEKALAVESAGRPVRARSLLERALCDHPADPDLLEATGRMLARQGQTRKSTHLLMEAALKLAEKKRCEDALVIFDEIKDAGHIHMIPDKRLMRFASSLHRAGLHKEASNILRDASSPGDSNPGNASSADRYPPRDPLRSGD